MRTNPEIKKKVEQTLSSIEQMEEVKVSPFFKEKVMHQIRNASEDKNETILSWFTPKLQLATLVCIVILNVIAFSNLEDNNYDENINEFAESYGLSTNTDLAILNDL
ncbi:MULTISPECIES: hypothetical protein [Winogradskyella]|uniref:Uncharacterized protein n=1 Tax=Winogradskyella ouciana TaxID=2608631 RepID=A0A7K1GDU2_9FLAO|nr:MULTISPECIES: hypothetical protein [Winogradskyella]MBO6879582.1 hypothetical protein [Winogradskyella sp.]MTE27466.1 hypothetical protein [Winogradskyella ouciana]